MWDLQNRRSGMHIIVQTTAAINSFFFSLNYISGEFLRRHLQPDNSHIYMGGMTKKIDFFGESRLV
jgi:hypothetical protein